MAQCPNTFGDFAAGGRRTNTDNNRDVCIALEPVKVTEDRSPVYLRPVRGGVAVQPAHYVPGRLTGSSVDVFHQFMEFAGEAACSHDDEALRGMFRTGGHGESMA